MPPLRIRSSLHLRNHSKFCRGDMRTDDDTSITLRAPAPKERVQQTFCGT